MNAEQNPRVRLEASLSRLGLEEAKAGLDWLLEKTSSGELDLTTALCDLAEREVAARERRSEDTYVRNAHLPLTKTFDDFDFGFQPTLNKERVTELRYLRFVERAENILFIGSPGVGKTHLACAIGVCAAKQHMSTYFIGFADLLERLSNAKAAGRLAKYIAIMSRYRVLIVDEIGFLPVTQDQAALFFQLVSARYEKHSTVITTNKSLGSWAETFGDPVLTNAILDRLLHHSQVFKIIGRSYRTKDCADVQQKKSPQNP